jgi:hypothetical protein
MIEIKMNTGNVYFREEDSGELRLERVAKILREVADQIQNGTVSGRILDGYGYDAGDFIIKDVAVPYVRWPNPDYRQ